MGRRMAKVKRVNRDGTVTVVFQATPGKKRIPGAEIAGVWFRKRVVPVVEWTSMRAQSNVDPEGRG